jgi:hypothetical protein
MVLLGFLGGSRQSQQAGEGGGGNGLGQADHSGWLLDIGSDGIAARNSMKNPMDFLNFLLWITFLTRPLDSPFVLRNQ